MHLEGEFVLNVTRQSVYDFILDPYQISQCIPGFQALNVKSRDDFVVILNPPSSLFKTVSALHFTTARDDRREHARFLAKGIGKETEVDIELKIQVEDLEIASSLIKWEVEAKLVGQVAHVASEKLARKAEKLVEAVTNCLRVKLEPKRP